MYIMRAKLSIKITSKRSIVGEFVLATEEQDPLNLKLSVAYIYSPIKNKSFKFS